MGAGKRAKQLLRERAEKARRARVAKTLRAPFPYFGGKAHVADAIWQALGDVDNYVEPFAGSAAVLLRRPGGAYGTETINDKDSFIVNFWRAVQADPRGVARHMDAPPNEVDLTARHVYLVGRSESLTERLMVDPEWYDVKSAGWWAWGACLWIGSGWCSGEGPWVVENGALVKRGRGRGVNRQLPHLADRGRGVNRKLPHLADRGRGVNRKLPHLGDRGRGALRPTSHLDGKHVVRDRRAFVLQWLEDLSDRLRDVRIACGDWSRVTKRSAFSFSKNSGAFLDPPYVGEHSIEYMAGGVTRDAIVEAALRLYGFGARVVLAGHEGDYDLPGWNHAWWRYKGGFGNNAKSGLGRTNADRERLWFSPNCLPVTIERSTFRYFGPTVGQEGGVENLELGL